MRGRAARVREVAAGASRGLGSRGEAGWRNRRTSVRSDVLKGSTFVVIVLLAVLATGCKWSRKLRGSRAGAAVAAVEARANPVGAAAYAKACAVCHGARGKGYRADNAPALAHPQFLGTASDDFLRRAIVRGRPGTTMSAWDHSTGGPFDARTVDALVRYVRAWQKGPRVAVDERAASGDVARGRAAFVRECSACHGREGGGGPYVSLTNHELLESASDGFLRHAITGGRTGTPMPAYAGTLEPQEIEDLIVAIRAMKQAPMAPTAEVPPKVLVDPVLNPKGPAPPWKDDAAYTKVDDVKAQMDRGARLIIADARPPSSYVEGHVVGAVSIPFYDAKSYAAQVPEDAWVVTYCGCPHAESGQVAAALRAAGHSKVTVMDEGFNVWVQRKYPVKPGARP